MGVSLAGEIQSENVLSTLMYYIPGRGDPKRMKVGDLLAASVSIYTEDMHWRQNKVEVRLSTGSNLQVQVPIYGYLHLQNPKCASLGFWRVGNPNPWV